MYAVIETGGKQYRVKAGDVITVEKLDAKIGEKIKFDKVLMSGDGKDLEIGKPYVNTEVVGEVVESGKGKKVIIFKYKAKKDYRKKQGHRQPYTMIKIVSVGNEVAPKSSATKAETKVETPKKEASQKNNTKKTETIEKKTASMSMKKDELIAFAQENNIKVDAKATKQVILDKINENLK